MASKLLQNTMIYALGDIIPKALSFVVFPVLTSYLTLADYGIVNYVNTIIFFLTTIGFLCLNTYYLVYYYRVGSEQEQRKLLGNLSIFVVGLNLLLSVGLFAVGTLFNNVLSSNIDFFPYIALGVGTNFFNILTVLPSALYRVQERPLPLTILNVLKGVITMSLTLVLVVHYGYTAIGVLWSMFIVSAFFGFIFLYITLRNMTWNINWAQIKQALWFSLPLLPGSLAYYFLSMADRLFIEQYLDLTQLGIYSTASTLAMILNIVAYGAYKAFEPHFFKIYGEEGFISQFVRIQNVFILVVLFGAMCLSVFAKEFFVLFSSVSYHGVYYYVPMVELGVVFSAVTMLYATIVTAREKTKINSAITILGGGLSVVLNLVLLPHIGILAACVASSTALGFIMIACAYYAKLNISFTRPILSFIVSCLVVIVLVYVIDFESMIVSIIVKVLSLCFCVGVIMRILGLNINGLLLPLRNKGKS